MGKFNLKKDVFDFVYGEAMNDAIRQTGFMYKIGTKKEESDIDWIKKVKGAKEAVENYVEGVLYGKNKSTFKETAKQVCESIEKERKKHERYVNRFTFGNAQKLINMTAKHFYILCYNNECLKENFQDCHCPMDSKMLEIVFDKTLAKDNKEYKERENYKLGENMYSKSSFTDSWSKLDWVDLKEYEEIPQKYTDFQACVRKLAKEKGISPIEYDYCHWGE